ncbi:hypothetical protein [Desulfosediminicola ganghwensis]|nr:hypothetical protein [Desulfosediminicola ganghwensis]
MATETGVRIPDEPGVMVLQVKYNGRDALTLADPGQVLKAGKIVIS